MSGRGGSGLRAPEIDFDRILPTKCCGIPVDGLLEFQTEKVIRVKSGVLGAIYFFACLFFFFYVVIYQILYRNEHFQLFDVEGTARVTIQQPTKNSCNPNKPDCEDDFTRLTELPYCHVEASENAVALENALESITSMNNSKAPSTQQFIVEASRKTASSATANATIALQNVNQADKSVDSDADSSRKRGRKKGLLVKHSRNLQLDDETEEEREAFSSLLQESHRGLRSSSALSKFYRHQQPTKKKLKSTHVHGCIYADQHELVPQGMLSEQLFIPTRIDRHYEKLECRPSKANNWHCVKRYTRVKPIEEENEEETVEEKTQKKKEKSQKTSLSQLSASSFSKLGQQKAAGEDDESVYVADIERFTILIAHTYHRGGYSGNSMGHQGFVEMCVKEHEEKKNLKKMTREELMSMIQPFGMEEKVCPKGSILKRVPIPCYRPGKCLFPSLEEEEKWSWSDIFTWGTKKKTGNSGGNYFKNEESDDHAGSVEKIAYPISEDADRTWKEVSEYGTDKKTGNSEEKYFKHTDKDDDSGASAEAITVPKEGILDSKAKKAIKEAWGDANEYGTNKETGNTDQNYFKNSNSDAKSSGEDIAYPVSDEKPSIEIPNIEIPSTQDLQDQMAMEESQSMGDAVLSIPHFFQKWAFARARRNFEQRDDPWVRRISEIFEAEARLIRYRADQDHEDEQGELEPQAADIFKDANTDQNASDESDEDEEKSDESKNKKADGNKKDSKDDEKDSKKVSKADKEVVENSVKNTKENQKDGFDNVNKLDKTKKNTSGDFFALPNGDVFSFERLLALGGVDLDKQLNSEMETKREAGTLLEVSVEYRNLYPWWSTFHVYDEAIEYTYRVSERPVDEMKTEIYGIQQPKDYPDHRVIENRHGVQVVVRVGGTFGFLNLIFLVVMLTTSVVLLAAVRRGIDFIGLNIMKGKERYQAAKFEDISL